MVSGDSRATCAICFREFLTDERGRLFPHVRRLRSPERCMGYKFQPAGQSLYGTQWALDRAASVLLDLDARRQKLEAQPPINGVFPFNPMYPNVWNQAVMGVEHERSKVAAELDELAARLEEWRQGAPHLEPGPIHRVALWKCRAGTTVPLCYSEARHRPSGDPIMVPTMEGVDCRGCHQFAELFSIVSVAQA